MEMDNRSIGYVRESNDGGLTWSEPRLVYDYTGQGSLGAGPIVVTREGTVCIVLSKYFCCDWAIEATEDLDKNHLEVWCVNSFDGGKTWMKPQQIDIGHSFASSSPSICQLRSGRILLPTAYLTKYKDGRFRTSAVYSDDLGRTWQRSPVELGIGGGKQFESGACESVVCEIDAGKVWMLIRSQDGYLWETFSNDGGHTWDKTRPSRFVSGNTSVGLLKLRDGRVIVAWNNHFGRPFYDINSYGRQTICAAISDDGGRTWSGYRAVARTDPQDDPDFMVTSPCLAEKPDGKVLLGYNHVHAKGGTTWADVVYHLVMFDPSWLEERSLIEDFADGVNNWVYNGTQGFNVQETPEGKSLALRRVEPSLPCSGTFNFPFARRGRLTMRVFVPQTHHVLMGGGFTFALRDSFIIPVASEFNQFSLRFESPCRIIAKDPDGPGGIRAISTGVQPYEKPTWQDVEITWDCEKQRADLFWSGQLLAKDLPLFGGGGYCYLNLSATNEPQDKEPVLIRRIELTGKS